LLGLENSVQQEAGANPQLAADDWAKPYVSLALKQGLLDAQGEASDSGVWGQQPATREWATKLAIRVIDRQADADRLASAPSTFSDFSQSTPSLRGYINAAVELNIVEGFSDNTFKPLGRVTRAQMATILSNALPYLTTNAANTSSP